MSSHKFRIEVFEDDLGYWSYACPEYDLHGYNDVFKLLKDVLTEERERKVNLFDWANVPEGDEPINILELEESLGDEQMAIHSEHTELEPSKTNENVPPLISDKDKCKHCGVYRVMHSKAEHKFEVEND